MTSPDSGRKSQPTSAGGRCSMHAMQCLLRRGNGALGLGPALCSVLSQLLSPSSASNGCSIGCARITGSTHAIGSAYAPLPAQQLLAAAANSCCRCTLDLLGVLLKYRAAMTVASATVA
eukprot:TRINITY_DN1646_c0_g1_i2.p4 TRINITY_DN1646_c0_g1~~TRINITY_DN1646_c0_g1_i2.p4  ORF type:complete len:119 (+),score=31.85 TRINITY_DN1646_c0_g1_i2:516-872(+)